MMKSLMVCVPTVLMATVLTLALADPPGPLVRCQKTYDSQSGTYFCDVGSCNSANGLICDTHGSGQSLWCECHPLP